MYKIYYRNSHGPILKELNCHTLELDNMSMDNEELVTVSE